MKTDDNKRVKNNSADALGHLGEGVAGVIPALADALHTPSTRHMAIFALMALKHEADPAVPTLVKYIDDDEHEDSVVMALQEIGTESAKAALRAGGHPEQS